MATIAPFRIIGILLVLYALPFKAAAQQKNTVDVSMNTGFQSENFGWSIAGNLNGQNPNIYSELKWEHLNEAAASANLTWHFFRRFYFMGGFARNFIISGKVSDTDYGSDNRTTPIYHGDFRDDKGYTGQVLAGLGFMAARTNRIQVSAEAGVTAYYQSSYLLGLGGQYPTLNTRYVTTWKGAFAAGSFVYALTKKIDLHQIVRYSQLSYNAWADWNLIAQFAHPVSYRDNAEGFALQSRSAISYQIVKDFSINLAAGFGHSQTGNGIDKLYLANGAEEQTQFNAAKGGYYQVTVGLCFKVD